MSRPKPIRPGPDAGAIDLPREFAGPGLTYFDILAALNEDGARLLPWEFDRLTDADILYAYCVPRDRHGRRTPLRERLGCTNPAPEAEPPSAKELDIPREAMMMAASGRYTQLFWQVHRQRGEATDQIMAAWVEHLKTYRTRRGARQGAAKGTNRREMWPTKT